MPTMRPSMTVKLSEKFQIAIPAEARRALKLKPGQQLRVFIHEQRLELVIVPKASAIQGLLKGMDTHLPRDKDRL